jgi:hypothetical protein
MIWAQGVMFEDYNIDDDGFWTQVCEECQAKYNFRNARGEVLIDIPITGTRCGVAGCENEADFYLDFATIPIQSQRK